MLQDVVRKSIKESSLIDKGDTVIVGISGGPDSVALLLLLNSLKKELGFKIHLAHLDHGLRSGSAKDCRFVEKLANKLGLSLTVKKIRLKNIIRKGSIEEGARKARFAFFSDVAKREKADKVALGHNQDDQAETVLMRILRGSGLYGLNSILPKRKIDGLVVVRPLLSVSRLEINRYLKTRKIKACVDESNSEDIYLRNRIRNELLPYLEKKYNKNIKRVLSNLALNSAYDYDYLRQSALLVFNRSNKGYISLSKLVKLHPAIKRLLFRMNIAWVKGDTRAIASRHITEIDDLVSNRPVGSIVDLPKCISVIKQRKVLRFYLRNR